MGLVKKSEKLFNLQKKARASFLGPKYAVRPSDNNSNLHRTTSKSFLKMWNKYCRIPPTELIQQLAQGNF